MDPDTVSIWISLISLILASVVVYCQKAVCGVPDAFVKQIFEEKDDNKILRILLKSPRRFKSAMRCGYTFLHISFAISALISIRNTSVFKNPSRWITNTFLLLFIILFTLCIMVISRGVPKRLARKCTEKQISAVSRLAFAFYIVFYPLRAVCDLLVKLVSSLFGVEYKASEDYVSEQEIRMLMDVSEGMGGIEQHEKEMINNIFELDDRTVDSIMTHRTDTIFIEKDDTLQDIINLVNRFGYSRFPVIGENIDDVVGIVNVKDLLKLINHEEKRNSFKVEDYMREPLFVPETIRCRDMFAKFNISKAQIAVIVDEYGGTSGIITMEDIVESIVGDIEDEYDKEDMDVRRITNDRYIFDGDVSLNEVAKAMDCDLGELIDEYETLGGLIIGQLERIPNKNEKATIEIDNIVFTVVSSNPKQILKVIAYRNEKTEENDDYALNKLEKIKGIKAK